MNRLVTARVRIVEWAAWTSAEGARHIADIAPLLRRRMSPLARMAVAVGLECCHKAGLSPAAPRVVFASRHGEMGVTVDLLNQMAAGETLSPTGFSNSVHHAAAGYWSLAMGNRQATRAVAGGEASFCYGFLDAIGMLGEADRSPVLLIVADDQVPPPFEAVSGQLKAPYAAAFLLAPAKPAEAHAFSFAMRRCVDTPVADDRQPGIPALDFLQWHLKGDTSLELVLSQRSWRWEK
jgi:hypothetical protein